MRHLVVSAALLVAAAGTTPSAASAQSRLYDRIWSTASSSVTSFADSRVKPQIYGFKRPVSFSILTAMQSSDVEAMLHDAIIRKVVDVDCVNQVLETLVDVPDEAMPQADGPPTQAEAAYLKTKGLKPADLAEYKAYKAKHDAEIKRLATLDKPQAEAESFKLKEIDTEWTILGHRSAFKDLEDTLDKSDKNKVALDTKQLRSDIFDQKTGNMRFRLSVPIGQWSQFDAWIRLRRQSIPPAPSPDVKLVDSPSGGNLNEDRCDEKTCSSALKSGVLTGKITALSVIAPQVELPWMSKFRKAASNAAPPAKDCTAGTTLDRIVLARHIGTSYAPEMLSDLTALITVRTPFLVEGIQFSGIPDIGVPYYSSPSIEDGTLVSPYYYLLGFSTVPTKTVGQ